MNLELDKSKNGFTELNQYMLDIQNLISASAASTCIIQNDRIVNEWYSGYHGTTRDSRVVDAQSRFNIASIRKTYLGFAISLALHEGKIKSLDNEIFDYLKDLDEDMVRNTTIRHLLTHTHGLQGTNKRIFPPGTDWKYNNSGVNMLIRLVQQIFERPLAAVLEETVFNPLGFTETGWIQDKNEQLVWLDESYEGQQGSEANLFVSTRELAYWGYVHLMKGKVRGEQMIPGMLFDQVTSIITPAQLDEGLPRNGFFWWIKDRHRSISELGNLVPEGSYQSLGFYGNAVLVIPEYKVVAVKMLNQTEPNPPEYDYLKDIQTFGNLVCQCVLSK
jgi:CubicO group peptidase (beta-lactamase class C family)